MELPERLKLAADRSGLSMSKLSESCGQTRNWLSEAIRSRAESVNARALERLAEVTGVSLVWLLTGKGSPDGEPSSQEGAPAPLRKYLPGWYDGLAVARRERPIYGEAVWAALGESAAVDATNDADPRRIVRLADGWVRLQVQGLSEADKAANEAEFREAEAALAAMQREQEKRAKKG